MKRFIPIVFLFGVSSLYAQDAKSQFEQFKSQAKSDFERAMQQHDSIFAKSMVDNWKAIQLNEPQEKATDPKPALQPTTEPSFELEDLEHKFIDTQPKLMRSFSPISSYEEVSAPDTETLFEFFGEQTRIEFNRALFVGRTFSTRNENDLADAWRTLSKLPYQSVTNALMQKKEELALPDYGYLLLVEQFLNTQELESVNKELYTWFFLVKSGFVARIGLINQSPVLIIGSYGKVYGKRYYSSAGLNYYITSDTKGTLESYVIESDADNNPFEFSITEEIKLPLQPIEKKFNYTSKNGEVVNLKIYHNQNVVDMLDQFPQVDLSYYLSSKSSDLLSRSIDVSFKEILEGKSEIERVEFLLEFVQKGFAYKSDAQQFGRERVLYPEELFFYPFTDCDDRVVLLSYLLKKFVDVPMVGVGFPQHVALALKLSSTIKGESINYNGSQFTFCDPTYLGAPVGSVIPTANRKEIKVIEF